VLDGTTITANFNVNGTLNGTAGCNTYTASYAVSGTQLEVGAPVAGRQICETPDGIMQQETTYLSLLDTAASYQINASQLVVSNSSGQTVLTFSAAQ
jgi:heat shock protein HslJ